MQLDISQSSLIVYEALASKVRIEIIQLLSKNKLNVKEIAEKLNLSSAIVTKHIAKLEAAGLIKTDRIPGKSGIQKVSSLKIDRIEITFPQKIYYSYEAYEASIPVGHYTDYSVKPTCGLANLDDFIGQVDQPKYFMDPNRMSAQILWFTEGFVEYKLPNYLTTHEQLEVLEISLEISSEFPYSNDVWPSDITFSLNGIELGCYTSPGDFADTRGKLTPDWWPSDINQYGLLKTLRITKHGTYMNGQALSDTSILDFQSHIETWNFKIEVKEDAKNVGGLTIFGKGFGNHNQDIKFKIYYS